MNLLFIHYEFTPHVNSNTGLSKYCSFTTHQHVQRNLKYEGYTVRFTVIMNTHHMCELCRGAPYRSHRESCMQTDQIGYT